MCNDSICYGAINLDNRTGGTNLEKPKSEIHKINSIVPSPTLLMKARLFNRLIIAESNAPTIGTVMLDGIIG